MDSKSLRFATLVSFGLTSVRANAELQLPGAILSVRNPPSRIDCVDEGKLTDRVKAQLTSAASAEANPEPSRFEIVVERDQSGVVAHLRVSGRIGGTRRIEAERCDGLTDALAVTLAMILDQDAQELRFNGAAAINSGTAANGATTASGIQPQAEPSAAESTEESQEPEGIAPSDAFASPTVQVISPAEGHSRSRVELRAWLGGGYGSPGSGLLETGMEFNLQDWALQLSGYWQPKYSVAMNPGTLELTAMGGGLASCRRFGDNWRVSLCLRGDIGAERARVKHSDFKDAAPDPQLAAHVGPSLGLETGKRWVAGLELLERTAFYRDRFEVTGSTASYEPSLFSLWLIARVALSNHPE